MANRYDSVPMPKDADGRVVPLDTKVLYDANGKKVNITSFTFKCSTPRCWAYWEAFSPDVRGEDGMLYVEGMHLIKPDSWEVLEEDARKDICDYFGHDFVSNGSGCCNGCPAEDGVCSKVMASDLVRRAKALAGVADDD